MSMPGQDRDEQVSGGKGRVAHSVNRGEHSDAERDPTLFEWLCQMMHTHLFRHYMKLIDE